jgi:hypothetical protein
MSIEKEPKIGLNDSLLDIIMKMVDGNHGAMTVCMELLNHTTKIDPDVVLGPLTSLLTLDMHHIYAEQILMLYKDVCGEDIVKMVAILRAVQLGLITSEGLKHAINNYGAGVDVDDLVRQVKVKLPRFGTEEEIEGGT